MKKLPEPRKYLNNVHFWLRKIYYFVSQLDPELSVEVTDDPDDPTEKEPKEWTELQMRRELRNLIAPWRPEEITQEEAVEACEKLYEMLNSIMDPAVIAFVEDPYCAGARPRRITG